MYRIIGADGKEYGPVSIDQMRQWIAEGRVNAQTKVLAEGTTEWKTINDFPELAGAPPAPGVSPAVPPPMTALPGAPSTFASSGAADQVNGPAIGLIITGALNIVLAVARVIMTVAGVGVGTFANSNNEAEKMIMSVVGTFGLVFGIVGILGGILILLGGIKMKSLQSYGLCMTASIVAMIPCLSSCCLVGLPIGIWALVVLSKPEVKSSFN